MEEEGEEEDWFACPCRCPCPELVAVEVLVQIGRSGAHSWSVAVGRGACETGVGVALFCVSKLYRGDLRA